MYDILYVYLHYKSTIHVGKYPKNDMTQNNSHPNLSAPGVPHVGKYTKLLPLDLYWGAIRMGLLGHGSPISLQVREKGSRIVVVFNVANVRANSVQVHWPHRVVPFRRFWPPFAISPNERPGCCWMCM